MHEGDQSSKTTSRVAARVAAAESTRRVRQYGARRGIGGRGGDAGHLEQWTECRWRPPPKKRLPLSLSALCEDVVFWPDSGASSLDVGGHQVRSAFVGEHLRSLPPGMRRSGYRRVTGRRRLFVGCRYEARVVDVDGHGATASSRCRDDWSSTPPPWVFGPREYAGSPTLLLRL